MSGDPKGSLDLPPNSPLVPVAAYNAVELLKALRNLQLTIVDTSGVAHQGVISILGTTAVIKVQL